jgi:hypothetical protein
MSELVLYKAGDTLEIGSGGVLFMGSITKIKTGTDVGFSNNEHGLRKSKTQALKGKINASSR